MAGDVPADAQRRQIFLLSPATAHGPRAALLRAAGSASALANRLRSSEGVPIGEVFRFLSGLYFRGKLEYAETFAVPPPGVAGVHILTMTDGVLTADTPIHLADLERFASAERQNEAGRTALERSARQLSIRVASSCQVVLLGSVNTGKYTDVLSPLFGDRLIFPVELLRIGQLARGALLLRQVREREELHYAPVSELIRFGGRAVLRDRDDETTRIRPR